MELEASDMEGLEMDEQTDLKQQLDKAVATIIKLRATANQITETEIRDDFESLQRAIQDWVIMIDKELKGSHKDYKHMFLETFTPQDDGCEDDEEDNRRLFSALKGFGITDGSDHGHIRKWMSWLGRLNTCIHVVFCRGIWTCLERYIFSMKYPVGVDLKTEDTFTSIIRAMNAEDGDGDERSRANKWRSETMNAYKKTIEFRNQQETDKREILDRLNNLIMTLLKNRISIRNHHIRALENDIFGPAINLHQRMTCSSFEYKLETPKLMRGERPPDSKVSSWKFQDMVKWRPIDSEDIGGVFQCLYPTVYRVGKTREEDVIVCEATILAYDKVEGPTTIRSLMSAPVTLHESPRESPQQSPRGSPERQSRGLRKAYTDDERRRISTVTSDEDGISHNWRRHNTEPSPSPTHNASKPKHRHRPSILDKVLAPLESFRSEMALDDPGKFRSRSSLANRGSSMEPDQHVMSRDSAPKSRSQPSSRRPSYSQTVSASTRESDMPSAHAAPSTRRETRHRHRPSDIYEEVSDNLEPYSERKIYVEDIGGHKATVYSAYKDGTSKRD